jgi:hypothetical protein
MPQVVHTGSDDVLLAGPQVGQIEFTTDAVGSAVHFIFDGCVRFNAFALYQRGPAIEFESDSSGDFEVVSPAFITVLLDGGDPGQTYTVDYAVIGGTATRNVDYVLADGTLTFHPGGTAKPVTIRGCVGRRWCAGRRIGSEELEAEGCPRHVRSQQYEDGEGYSCSLH